MSARDDLADLIEAAWWGMPSSEDQIWEKLADAVIAAGWRPPVDAPEPGRRATVQLFKPSGKYYTTDSWAVPVGAIGPYDMEKSPDFRRIGGTGAVLVCSEGELAGDENWGFPHLFPGLTEETDEGES